MGNAVQKPKEMSEKREEEEEDEDVSSFTCEICIEPVTSNKRFKNKSNCGNHLYCLDCIEKYIQAMIEEYNLSEIKCPALECEEVLDPVMCREFLSTKVFVRWCDVLCKSAILHYQQRVYCPFSDCSSLILNECGGKIKKTKCPNCKRWLCFECKVPWHAGYGCPETGEMRDRNDVLLGHLMEIKKWKRCPTCHHGVQLKSGCPLVKCRCGNSFCYNCGRELFWCRCRRNNFYMRLFMVEILWIMLLLVLVVILVFLLYGGIKGYRSST